MTCSRQNEKSQDTPISAQLNTKQDSNDIDHSHNAKRQSLETNDSQQIIIRKTMSWSVEQIDRASSLQVTWMNVALSKVRFSDTDSWIEASTSGYRKAPSSDRSK